MEMRIILATCIVNFEMLPVRPSSQVRDYTVIMETNDANKIQSNIRNLFDSIAKNDQEDSGVYRRVLKQEIAKEQNAFDAMKDELRRARNTNKKFARKIGNSIAMSRRTAIREIRAIDYRNSAGCLFPLNEDAHKTPLILKNGGEAELLYPDIEYDVIHVPKNTKIRLTCLDKEFSKLHAKTVDATCAEDGNVRVRGRKMKLSELKCEKFPSSTLLRTNRSCQGNSTEYEVGFQLSKKFLKTMSVCFDEVEKKAVYSWYESTKLHTGHQKNVERPQFVNDGVYDFDVNKAYFRKEQIKSFAKILKSKAQAEKYIQSGNTMYYLARGHLTPKADFVYGSEQASSFHYANVVPQWQVFNEGNWLKVEESVRKLLIDHPNRYVVQTGTYGVATLPDIDNVQQELYLYVDSSEKKLPVPKLLWKTVFDKKTAQGVTIVGLNNPYLGDIPNDYVICQDICDSVNWFDVDTKNVDLGYLYCCDMKEFFKVTGYKNIFEETGEEVTEVEKTMEEDVEEKEEVEEVPESTTESTASSEENVIIVYFSRVLSTCRKLFTSIYNFV